MLRLLPVLLFLTSCQALGIKETDTIQQAEVKVLHNIESKVGISPDAEVPYAVSPTSVKS